MTERRPPLGQRGLRSGPDAWVNEQEARDARRREQPRVDGHVVGSTPVGVTASSQVFGALSLRLILLDPMERDREYSLTEARIQVQTASAGTTARTAIYSYNPQARSFVIIPGTAAEFSAATTGQKSVTLPITVVLRPETLYFIAFKASSAVPGFAAVVGATRVINSLAVTHADMILPVVIQRSALTETAAGLPLVTYVSSTLADVI